MTTLEYKLADSYFERLKSLSNEAKLRLIHRLTASMLGHADNTAASREAVESEKDSRLSQLFGIWSDGPTAEEVIDEIRRSRTSGVTRHIIPLDE